MTHYGLIGLFLFGCLFSNDCAAFGAEQKSVREPVVAGQFYPNSREELAQQIQQYLDQAQAVDLPGTLHALVAPHAGYIYSAPVAAYAYQQIRKPFTRVFILASNHSQSADFAGLAAPLEYTHFLTPLGEVPVSPLVQTLVKEQGISSVSEAQATHVIEVQLPFLQTVLKNFEIVPLITGRIDWADVKRFGELLNQYVDDDTLFIVSSDLSHYHAYDEAVSLDKSCIQALEQLDTPKVIGSELCGQGAALILLEIAKKQGWNGKILDYRNSGDTAGDKTRVVGYSAIAYYAPNHAGNVPPNAPAKSADNALSEEEQTLLLELAHTTLERYVKNHEIFEPDAARFSAYPHLTEQRGVFVTLKKQGDLRGCIGSLIGQKSVYLGVRDHAINAAAHDPRFSPVTENELADITLSISVLDVPQLLEVTKPDEYLQKLTHDDGVIIMSGGHSATYLPQVWEQLPDVVEFLSQLCQKGGAESDCWKQPETKLYTYHAQEFGHE